MNKTKKVAVSILGLLIISTLFGQSAYAADYQRRSRTYDIQYDAADSGRYRMNSQLREAINDLDDAIVVNVRIPILFCVTVGNLEDTWGDARSDGRTHEGIDIMAPRGTFIVSPTDAVVTTVENSGNGGNHVFTANPGGERYYFAHLDHFAEGLAEGQVLKAGDLIGYVGNTGNAAGGPTHLHFGMYHDDHEALNPYPRLTLEFSLQDRMDAVKKILNNSADPKALARTLVDQHRVVFMQAQISGIELHSILKEVLIEKIAETLSITRTLKVGMRGDDVKSMQASLGVTADGVFGPQTRAALITFQKSHGLTADGIFGPKSRLALASSGPVHPVGCTSSAGYSVTTGIKCT